MEKALRSANRQGGLWSADCRGFGTSPTRALAQVAGTAFRVSAKAMEIFCRMPRTGETPAPLRAGTGIAGAQLAACNRLHEVDERLARWLLMSQDAWVVPIYR